MADDNLSIEPLTDANGEPITNGRGQPLMVAKAGTDSHAIGSVVRLNSGSPDLTVTKVDSDGVHVAWLNEIGALSDGCFPAACLSSRSRGADRFEQMQREVG